MTRLSKLPFRSDRATDIKFMGEEPTYDKPLNDHELGDAYNWYNYFFGEDAAKAFTVAYMTENNFPAGDIASVKKLKIFPSPVVGWVCRILSLGGQVPEATKTIVFAKLKTIVSSVEKIESTEEVLLPVIKKTTKDASSEVIGLIEDELDNFYTDNYRVSSYDFTALIKKHNLDKNAMTKVIDYYTPLLNEVLDAQKNKTEGYKLTPSQFKNYVGFLTNILNASKQVVSAERVVKTRKPYKTKPKSVEKIVSRVKIKLSDDELKVKSAPVTGIVGASQLWTFNTKYRILTKYVSEKEKGLTVKGTTILDFDPKLSVSKRVRKPSETIQTVLDTGKVGLRKLMDEIKTSMIEPTGRLNEDILLLRIVKE